jgi:hypothetical protein
LEYRVAASPDLKPPTGATRGGNKVPFTDEQLADIINACDGFNEHAPRAGVTLRRR